MSTPRDTARSTRRPPPARRVFVGNACLDDNVAERVKIAIWKAIGEPSHAIGVSVRHGVARLEGWTAREVERVGAEAAARGVRGVASVENRIVVDAGEEPRPPAETPPAQLCA